MKNLIFRLKGIFFLITILQACAGLKHDDFCKRKYLDLKFNQSSSDANQNNKSDTKTVYQLDMNDSEDQPFCQQKNNNPFHDTLFLTSTDTTNFNRQKIQLAIENSYTIYLVCNKRKYVLKNPSYETELVGIPVLSTKNKARYDSVSVIFLNECIDFPEYEIVIADTRIQHVDYWRINVDVENIFIRNQNRKDQFPSQNNSGLDPDEYVVQPYVESDSTHANQINVNETEALTSNNYERRIMTGVYQGYRFYFESNNQIYELTDVSYNYGTETLTGTPVPVKLNEVEKEKMIVFFPKETLTPSDQEQIKVELSDMDLVQFWITNAHSGQRFYQNYALQDEYDKVNNSDKQNKTQKIAKGIAIGMVSVVLMLASVIVIAFVSLFL
ncbi:MAG: hypothetical protein IPM74_14345 [Crocinitomicaceae bacterium]|nr:hypothetical protein [Crocinitomicaceae bacterium]MBK8927049.1 hypothetical protein [Crocinitomicaceae bacterium]